MRKFLVLEVNYKTAMKWLKDRDGFVFVVKVLGDTCCIDLISQTIVQDVTDSIWLYHSERLANSDFCFQRVEQHYWSLISKDRQSLRPSGMATLGKH